MEEAAVAREDPAPPQQQQQQQEPTEDPPPKMTDVHEQTKKPHKAKELGSPSARYGGYGVKDRRRPLWTFIVILLVLAAILALTVWLVYRPHKPKFRVISAAVYELNATAPPFVSASMQFTVVTRNPNRRVSIYYDHLSAFAAYKNQAITPPAILPPLYQETKSTVALSPLLGGAVVPMTADVVNALVMDQNYGVVDLRLVLAGKLRYKAGAIRSGRYGIYVRCDLFVQLKRGFVGQLSILESPPCLVDV